MQKVIYAMGFVFMVNMFSWGDAPWKVKAYAAESSMAQVQLILKKLRGSMASMKDFDALEKAGMDKKDVDRLRRAMKAKIQQMTSDAVELISAL